MKRFTKILHNLRELPEEIRRVLSTILLAAAAIVLFFAWGALVSSRLAVISENSNLALQTFEQKRNEASQETSGPPLFSGIRESLESVFEKLAPAEKTRGEALESFFAKSKAFAEKTILTLEKIMDKTGKFIISTTD